MSLFGTPLNKQVFERIGWQEVVAVSAEKECQRYSGLFLSKAEEAKEAGDGEAREAFAVLGELTSMMLWWLVLRICMIYVLVNRNPKREEAGETG